MTSDRVPFATSGALRRARRLADLSQREMAEVVGLPRSTVGAAEAGARDVAVGVLARVVAVAGLRLALLDGDGSEVPPMDGGVVRDMGNRYFPAHLDTRRSEEGWWHGPERYSRREPWYTFDRDRRWRDVRREREGLPADHRLPEPGDAPDERRAARRRAARERAVEQFERRQRAGELPPLEPWLCDCPPGCAELEDWAGPPRHTAECPCGCDPC